MLDNRGSALKTIEIAENLPDCYVSAVEEEVSVFTITRQERYLDNRCYSRTDNGCQRGKS